VRTHRTSINLPPTGPKTFQLFQTVNANAQCQHKLNRSFAFDYLRDWAPGMRSCVKYTFKSMRATLAVYNRCPSVENEITVGLMTLAGQFYLNNDDRIQLHTYVLVCLYVYVPGTAVYVCVYLILCTYSYCNISIGE
jgi:hypothetical protein